MGEQPQGQRAPSVADTMSALAEVRACKVSEIAVERTGKGDVEITSTELMAVIAILEEQCGASNVFSPTDFATPTTSRTGKGEVSPNGCMDPAEGTSVNAVTTLFAAKLAARG